ncbi:MAG: single-stranded nucleic acid binding domain protein [Lachnospiraceae bacterium]|jgi:spoIIIJ-associated protein|nr:single-stranded nucleic acid binding domain protein [Lachnospiraceae bacterium]
MEWLEVTGKTVDEALTEALIKLKTTSDNVEYEIIEKESSGFLGLFNKPAKIRVKVKASIDKIAKDFLDKIFKAMVVQANVEVEYNQTNATMDINIQGDDMGVLIGKRGQTLDSLQYLVSLVVNKDSENYIKVKLDTENYRFRRKETLENLAKNIAFKVKRTKKPVTLEPMNPYERRIIHSALQNDKFVETHSEGEEPFRKVVIALKKNVEVREYRPKSNKYSYGKSTGKDYGKNRNYGNKQVTSKLNEE